MKKTSELTLSEISGYNKKILNDYRNKFLTLFNLNLQNYLAGNFLTLITGFDIIEFDKDIKTPDGISTKDWVRKKFGTDAQNLISWLIQNTGLPPTKERERK